MGAGETWKVCLDEVSSHIRRRGVEIGVTDLDPMTLESSLPKTATDLRSGRTVIVSGENVAMNGKVVEKINFDTYDTKVGAFVLSSKIFVIYIFIFLYLILYIYMNCLFYGGEELQLAVIREGKSLRNRSVKNQIKYL